MSVTETRREREAPIDPRIRARRVAVVRAEGRRRLRLMLTLVGAASLAGLLWLTVESPLLDVDRVRIQGTARVSAAEVLAAARVPRGDPLLLIDTGAVTRRVEALPWVARAHVSVSLDGTVAISVTDRSVAAWARTPEPAEPSRAASLVDARGRVVMAVPAPPAGLPELQGLRGVPSPGHPVHPARAAALLGELPEALRVQVVAVALDGGDARLVLAAESDGRPTAGEVRLGPMTAVRAKAAAALAVLRALSDDVGYLDVRVPQTPTTGPLA